MVMQPVHDNIVIKLEKVEKEMKTGSGIILSSASVQQEAPEKGIIVAVGTGRILSNGETIKPCVSIGDNVIFNKFAGTKIATKDEEFLIIKENDVLAIIK